MLYQTSQQFHSYHKTIDKFWFISNESVSDKVFISILIPYLPQRNTPNSQMPKVSSRIITYKFYKDNLAIHASTKATNSYSYHYSSNLEILTRLSGNKSFDDEYME